MASQTWDNDYSTCATDMSTCFYVSRHLTKLASSFVHRPKSTRSLQVNTPKRVSTYSLCVKSLLQPLAARGFVKPSRQLQR